MVKKIAVDCRMLEMSGIGNYLENILYYWLQEKQMEFLLIGDKKKIRKLPLTLKCEILHSEVPIFSVGEIWGFPVKKINRCDLFFSPNYNIPFGIKIPIYSVVHDVVFLDIKNLVSRIGRFIRFCSLRRAVAISTNVFTVSQFSRSRIVFYSRCNPDKVIVGYNGINRKLLAREHDTFARIYDFEYFLFVGNIKQHKGIDILIEAYEKIADENKPKLVVVGSSNNFKTKDKNIIKFFDRHNSNLVFAGKVDDSTLLSLYKHAVALIQPSLYEGFGLPPLEAMYMGTKSIVSDIEVFREIYGSLPALFFESGNSQQLADKMQEAITARSCSCSDVIHNRFDYKKTAKLIFDIFQSLYY